MTFLRIQLKRTKGWRMPPNTIAVTRPGIYGNPFTAEDGYDGGPVVAFQHYLLKDALVRALYQLDRLRGRNLACWCRLCSAHADGKPFDIACAACKPCHADVLGSLANSAGKS